MTFKEFNNWCNERACDGMWGMREGVMCIEILIFIRSAKFWRRKKLWKDYCSQTNIVEIIIEPTNKLIDKYLSEMDNNEEIKAKASK
jgi:hypothetical protein